MIRTQYQLGVVGLILLLALLLRLPLLEGSFWLDEAAQALESARPISQQLNIKEDFQPPLLHLLTYAAIQWSASEWWLRWWGALLPGLLTIFVTYAIGKKSFSHTAGVIAASLLATSSLHIFYSQELRPYSLPALWAVLSSYVLMEWMRSDSKQTTKLVLYTLFSIAGLYSSYLYPFLFFGHIAWVVLLKRDLLKTFVVSLAVVGLSFLPWLPKFLEQLSVGSQVRTQLPGWEAVVSVPQLKSIPLVFAKFIFGVLNVELTAPFIGVSIGIMVAITYLTTLAYKKSKSGLVAMTIWLFVPLSITWIVSFWIPVIQPKRVLFLLPAFYLLVGAVIDASLQNQKSRNAISIGLLAVLLSLNIYSTARYFTDPILQREDWRSLHTQILEQYPADSSLVIFSFPGPFPPWTWYDDGGYPTLSTGKLSVSDVPDLPNLLKSTSDKEYILLFDYLRDLTDPTNEIPRALESLGFYERHTIDYPNIGFVRVFTRQATILSTTSL